MLTCTLIWILAPTYGLILIYRLFKGAAPHERLDPVVGRGAIGGDGYEDDQGEL